jgi:shikimate dehydrogenase
MNFYGLLGESLEHSFSPSLHKLIYQEVGLDAAYKLFPFPVAQLKQAMDGIRTLSIKGVNVTIPYKEAVIPYLDELDSLAKKLGAVNTIKNINGKLIGYNTDYNGFGLILSKRNWEVNGKTAVLLGSGGASKTVEAYLLDHGIKQIYVATRTPEQFKNTKNKTYTNYKTVRTIKGDYLINTTPIGMYPNSGDSPLDEASIQQFDYVIDLIYNPRETVFLKLGTKNKKQTANGLDMLVGQAVRAVEIWEGISVDEQIKKQLIFEWDESRSDNL